MRVITIALAILMVAPALATAEDDEPIFCMDDLCRVHEGKLDAAVKALASVADRESKIISFDQTLTTADIKAIAAKLPWVKRLRLDCQGECNDPIDVQALSALPKLRHLWLLGFRVKDMTPVYKLAELEQLDINVATAPGLEPFVAMKKLRRLDVRQLFLTDLSPLASMPGLEHIAIRGGKHIKDWQPLSQATQLRALEVGTLPDAAIVGKLVGLERLSIGNAPDLAPLASLKKLRALALWSCPTADLRPLAALSQLAKLELFGMATVTDVKPLAQLGKLEELGLFGTGVTDASPLLPLAPTLKVLSLPKGVDATRLKAANPKLRVN
jgi:hypothetical protein